MRMPESRVVRRALMALTGAGTHYPEDSLLMDSQTMPESRVVRRALMALTGAGNHYPKDSLLMDSQTMPFKGYRGARVAAHCMEHYVESTAI